MACKENGKPVENEEDKFSTDAIGRVFVIHPQCGEIYYLRMLLFHIKGPTCFHDLKTINDK